MTDLLRRMAGFLGVVAVGLVLIAGPAGADDLGRVPKPDLWKGSGEKCLEPAEDMRRYHMNYLKHQRNDTMYRGVRETKYSLGTCIQCHATPDPAIKEDNVRSVEHFCFECHKYAAVWIDCFQCHASKLHEEDIKIGGEMEAGEPAVVANDEETSQGSGDR